MAQRLLSELSQIHLAQPPGGLHINVLDINMTEIPDLERPFNHCERPASWKQCAIPHDSANVCLKPLANRQDQFRRGSQCCLLTSLKSLTSAIAGNARREHCMTPKNTCHERCHRRVNTAKAFIEQHLNSEHRVVNTPREQHAPCE